MRILTEDLDDRSVSLVNKCKPLAYRIWEASQTLVVLGRSSIAENEVYIDRCTKDNICIKKRRGGGCAVVLTQGMLIISIAKFANSFINPSKCFRKINSLIIEVLERNQVQNLFQRGISDLCIGTKKILGSCLYLSKGKLLYQASLLVNCDLTTVEKYLRHPSREPDYRKGRSHREFLTTLGLEGYTISARDLKRHLEVAIYVNLRTVT